jgi:hypothetical protein
MFFTLNTGIGEQRRTAFPDLLDAAQGFFRRRVARKLFRKPLKGPFRHARSNVEITGAQLLCRFSNAVF